MIIINGLTSISYLLLVAGIFPPPPNSPPLNPALPYILGFAGLINLGLAVALLSFKKWAFYGFCVSAVIILIVNVSFGVNPVLACLGLVGAALLYGVMQIGGERKAWNFLK